MELNARASVETKIGTITGPIHHLGVEKCCSGRGQYLVVQPDDRPTRMLHLHLVTVLDALFIVEEIPDIYGDTFANYFPRWILVLSMRLTRSLLEAGACTCSWLCISSAKNCETMDRHALYRIIIVRNTAFPGLAPT